MRSKVAVIILVALLLCVSLCLAFLLPVAHASTTSLIFPLSSPTPTTSPTGHISSTNGLDSTILAAIIGLVGVIIGAVIAGTFAIKQMRRTHQVERERQQDQFQHEKQMARLQKELARQYKAQEQEEQSKAATAEALRMKMLLAPHSERLETYKKSLHTDLRISQIQILTMSRPLEVNNVYVQVRVHQDTRPEYELDSKIRAGRGPAG